LDTNYIIYTLIAICLFFSALLSGSETAITLVPREKVHQLDDTKRNNKIRKAKDDLELTIGGILVANNFVNAKKLLTAQVGNLAIGLTGKLIQKNLDSSAQENVIQEFVEKRQSS